MGSVVQGVQGSTKENVTTNTLQMLFQRGLFEQGHLAVNGKDVETHVAFLPGLGREDGR